MFSRFLGKNNKSGDPPVKDAADTRGLEVVEDDPDTAWGLWDSALAEQDSKFSALQPEDAVSVSSQSHSVPAIGGPDFDQPTVPDGLHEKTAEQRKNEALDIVELHHHRIANTIRTLWGYKECSVYINKLIMNGGDGMGKSRIGFNQEAAQAMLVLGDLHDSLFGPAEAGSGLGFSDPSAASGRGVR